MSITPQSLGTQSYHLFRVNILVFVVRLVTGALTARALGVNAIGIWIVLSMLPSYAEAFGRLKFDVAAVYLLGQKRYRLGEMCFVLNLLAVFLSGIFMAALILLREPIARHLFGSHFVDLRLYYLMLLLIPLNFLGMNYAYLLLHLEQTEDFNRQNLIKNAGPGLLSVALIYGLGWGLLGLVVSTVVLTALSTAYSSWKVHQEYRLVPTFNLALMRDLIIIGLPMYLGGIVEYLNQYLSGLIVAIFMGPREVAFFRMGQDRLQVLDYLPGALNTALYPRLTKFAVVSDSVRLTTQACRIGCILMVGAGALGAVVAWPTVLVLYGREFLPMVHSIWLLLPGMILAGSTTPISQFFYASGRSTIPLVVSVFSLVVQVGLGVLLIPRLGFHGAALAMSVALLLQAILRLFLFTRTTGARVSEATLPRGADIGVVFRFAKERLQDLWLPAVARGHGV